MLNNVPPVSHINIIEIIARNIEFQLHDSMLLHYLYLQILIKTALSPETFKTVIVEFFVIKKVSRSAEDRYYMGDFNCQKSPGILFLILNSLQKIFSTLRKHVTL